VVQQDEKLLAAQHRAVLKVFLLIGTLNRAAFYCLQVQHCRIMAAHTEIGVPMIDMLRLFKAAAHEERWESLFAGFRV
jgi:hypothetical protein